MADRQSDNVGLDFLERPQMAFASVQGDARSPADCFVAARLAEARREVASAVRVARLNRDVREMLGGQRIAVAMEPGTEQHASKLANVAGPAVAHQDRECVVADGQGTHARMLRKAHEQVPDERGNVAASFPEGRQGDSGCADPFRECRIEAFWKLPAACPNDPYVDRIAAVEPDRTNLTGGEHA